MIHLTLSHIYTLLLVLSAAAVLYVISNREQVYGKISALVLWTGLIYSSFISLISFDGFSGGFTFHQQSGVLFALAALAMLPALINTKRYGIFDSNPTLGLIPYFIFFLNGFDHPLIWYLSFEVLSLFLHLSRGTFRSQAFRIRYFISSLILFLSLFILSAQNEQVMIRDYASFLLFSGLILRLYTPGEHFTKPAQSYYASFLQTFITILLIIRFHPQMVSMPVRVLGGGLLVISVIILFLESWRKQSDASYLDMSLNSLILPFLILSLSGTTYLYAVYGYLLLPMIILFLIKEDWWRTRYRRAYLLMLMTFHGIPVTAGSIVWIHFLKHMNFETLYSYFLLTGGTFLLAFWIYLYHKIDRDSHLQEKNNQEHFDLLLLFVLIFNLLLWVLFENFPRFFGF
ncbi:MAG: hypothetical protein DRP86_02375 [Candidatus Neomarinimicrobiota bacterium]|nr:hypothetical protein [Candidatus Neomarinimicrobiota bacterium]RKY51094.1 MAG: hypothetical protein DRP86_02375 [Candidatus Neomarinimicrobiota bacterium]